MGPLPRSARRLTLPDEAISQWRCCSSAGDGLLLQTEGSGAFRSKTGRAKVTRVWSSWSGIVAFRLLAVSMVTKRLVNGIGIRGVAYHNVRSTPSSQVSSDSSIHTGYHQRSPPSTARQLCSRPAARGDPADPPRFPFLFAACNSAGNGVEPPARNQVAVQQRAARAALTARPPAVGSLRRT